jgi:hypothetical protein
MALEQTHPVSKRTRPSLVGHRLKFVIATGMAGAAGIEPAHRGIKTRCLTTWLRPTNGGDHI